MAGEEHQRRAVGFREIPPDHLQALPLKRRLLRRFWHPLHDHQFDLPRVVKRAAKLHAFGVLQPKPAAGVRESVVDLRTMRSRSLIGMDVDLDLTTFDR